MSENRTADQRVLIEHARIKLQRLREKEPEAARAIEMQQAEIRALKDAMRLAIKEISGGEPDRAAEILAIFSQDEHDPGNTYK